MEMQWAGGFDQWVSHPQTNGLYNVNTVKDKDKDKFQTKAFGVKERWAQQMTNGEKVRLIAFYVLNGQILWWMVRIWGYVLSFVGKENVKNINNQLQVNCSLHCIKIGWNIF